MIQTTRLYHLVVIVVLLLPVGSLFARPSGMPDGRASAPDVKTGVEDVTARLQAHYDDTEGFRADFIQEVTSATLGQALNSRGRVFFKKPGRMRWEFEEPKQTLVCDGSFLWLYQPTEQQVIKTPFQHAFSSQTPVSFLTGVGRLEEDFLVAEQDETQTVYQLRLTPKKAPEVVGLLDIEVSKQTFDILQAMITDPLGNTTRLRFVNIERGIVMDEALFTFELPQGVDLVEPLSGF